MGFFDNLSRKLGFIDADDDREDELDEDEIEEDDEEEEEGGKFRLPLNNPFKGRNRQRAESQQEPDEDEEPEPQPRARKAASNVIRDARMEARSEGRAAQETEYAHVERIINVRQIEECGEIIQYLLHGDSVLLNLENVEPKDCGRVVDLLSGAAFALSGRMIKVAHLSYLLAPEHVLIVEEDSFRAGGMGYGRQ